MVLVALFLFALIEREARREVRHSRQVFTGLRDEGRDHLPVTSTQLLAAFAPLSLLKQRLRVGDEVVDVLTPTTLTPIQAQILQRLQLPPPTAYVQSSITPYPLRGAENESRVAVMISVRISSSGRPSARASLRIASCMRSG